MKSGKGAAKVSKDVLKPAADDRKIGKRKAVVAAVSDKSVQRKARQDKKAKKDPNKPKRPPSAFFVFLEDFRKTFKKENPNVSSVAAVGKAGGAKWKSLTPAEKAPYEAKAASRKDEYGILMNAYNKGSTNGNEGPVKTKPAVKTKPTKPVVQDEDDEADDEDEQDEEDDDEVEEEEEDDEDD